MSLFLLKLSWKNIWRNKRRTLLTVNAIALGVTFLIWGQNYYDSFHEQLIQNVIQYHSGHLSVSLPHYEDERETSLYLKNPSEIYSWLDQQPEVKAFSPRIHLQGMLSSAHGSVSLWFSGVDPAKEKFTTEFANSIKEGTYLDTKRPGKPIVIGSHVAERLKLKLGSKVVALTQGIDGSIGNELFYVRGIFETHSDLDKSIAFILLADARILLSLPPEAIHQVSILLRQDRYLNTTRDRFEGIFDPAKVQIATWMTLQSRLMGIIELEKSANQVLMFIILFIAAMGIANAILMSILERTREFGVMMAIGTSKMDMVKMVFTETLLLSLVGVLVGNVFGIAVTLYFNQKGFDLRWLTNQDIFVAGAMINTISYPTVQWFNNLSVTLVILSLSMLAAFIPVQHITKLNTISALNSR